MKSERSLHVSLVNLLHIKDEQLFSFRFASKTTRKRFLWRIHLRMWILLTFPIKYKQAHRSVNVRLIS